MDILCKGKKFRDPEIPYQLLKGDDLFLSAFCSLRAPQTSGDKPRPSQLKGVR